MKKAYLYILALVVWIVFLQIVCKLNDNELFKAGVSWILIGIFFKLCSIDNKLK